ncbi:MAG TPA: hypothetical protein PLR60_14280 [Syntrophorhabdaceae bacterium]|nr:hypothetical protein [Syntrophorhabdaceae bacterium]
MKERKGLLWIFLGIMGFLFAGCASIGPDSVVRDRSAYVATISDSWESQMLLNLVKLRYGHAPVFLDVASVITQYALQTQANVGASFQSPLTNRFTGDAFANTLSLGSSGSYTDRPTITYNPLMGEKFARSLMSPIPPAAILNLIQTGYRVDLLLRLCVQSVNGIQNSFGGPANMHDSDPEFHPLIEKMRRLQATGDIGIKIQKTKEKEMLRIILSWRANKAFDPDKTDILKLLGLDPNTNEFSVVYGAVPSGNKEIAILSRSILQIMLDLTAAVEVPEEHVVDKRVAPTFRAKAPDGSPIAPLVKVHCSLRRPDDAFVAVPFRNHWFWIDDKDVSSKNIFSFLMFIFTLTETGGKEGVPIVTIPAG